ncbi:uncharacterized protein LOC109826764 [Asparagus officinalis]|uniref:uncharacterized protein LOC109826764 n=1 Tax=Asparagus officinalis TaxID=4686 RepID=UPI00098E057F|nr:uncharacterized protein LOC109826764 [Asparagus officinalis]
MHKIYECVKDFGAKSGLEANPSKCSIFYGGVDESTKDTIRNCLGFPEGNFPIRYLGLPLISKRMSYMDCSSLFVKISGQFQTWLHRKLSYAGRLQVIKSVILGIQIFWISCYILPIKVLRQIDVLCRNFLWGKSDQAFKISLVNWTNVCTDKKLGGLGIFSATQWSIATALRAIWHIHMNKESLWIKWIHENYLKNRDIWHISAKSSDSWMWRQLLKVHLSDLYTALSSTAAKADCFSNRIWNSIMDWLQFKWRSADWHRLLDWYISRLRGKGTTQRIKRLAFSVAIYNIWSERNDRIFKGKVRYIDQLIRKIKVDILTISLNYPLPAEDKQWLLSL